MNIVSGYTTQYGRIKATPVLYDYDLLENWSNSIKPTTTGTEDATTKQTKYTFDLTGKTFDNYLSIYPSSSAINAVMYIYEISFSKPAN